MLHGDFQPFSQVGVLHLASKMSFDALLSICMIYAMRASTTFKLLGLGLGLAGCASITTQLPEVSPAQLEGETALQEKLAFEEKAALTQKLHKLARPILLANNALCPKTRQDIGVVTHKLKNYEKPLREAAARELGAQDELSILYVVEDSPAQRAGLRRGDYIINTVGKAVGPSHKLIQNQIEESGTIRIRRGGQLQSFNITPETICDYNVKLKQTPTINAYANGRSIVMTSGMMNFAAKDEEIAYIIGHELAHNAMGHIRKVVSNVILSLGATRYTRPFESEADYVGLYYMARAGYNPDNVEDIWRRLAVTNPKSVARAKTHPTYPDRYLAIDAARAEINAKKASGAPLIPNFKTGQSPN